MDFLSFSMNTLPRHPGILPQLRHLRVSRGQEYTASFNGPGILLLPGKEEQISIHGRNWGVKDAALLPVGALDRISVRAGKKRRAGSASGPGSSETHSRHHLSDHRLVFLEILVPDQGVSRTLRLDESLLVPGYDNLPLHALDHDSHTVILSLLNSALDGMESGVISHGDIFDQITAELLMLCIPGKKHPADPGSHTSSILTVYRQFIQYPEKDYDYRKIALELGMSFTNFRRHCKKVLKQSPNELLSHIRMDRACHLLSTTDKSIGDIARETGYADRLYFSRRFRQLNGMSPRAYRQESC